MEATRATRRISLIGNQLVSAGMKRGERRKGSKVGRGQGESMEKENETLVGERENEGEPGLKGGDEEEANECRLTVRGAWISMCNDVSARALL